MNKRNTRSYYFCKKIREKNLSFIKLFDFCQFDDNYQCMSKCSEIDFDKNLITNN